MPVKYVMVIGGPFHGRELLANSKVLKFKTTIEGKTKRVGFYKFDEYSKLYLWAGWEKEENHEN